MTLIEAIAQYLHDAGVGAYRPNIPGGTIYIGRVPPTPDQVIVLFPSGGFAPDAKLPYDNPTFQVRTRGTMDPRTSFNKAMEVYSILQSLHQEMLPGDHVVTIIQAVQSAPIGIGPDENRRYEYTQNYQVLGHVVPTVHRSV